MKTLEVILLAAGHGRRFLSAGIETPKPLIPVGGRPMFLWAVDSVERLGVPFRVRIVTRDDLVIDFASYLKKVNHFFSLSGVEPTRGPLETALKGIEDCDPKSPVAFLDCDTCFWCKSLEEKLGELLRQPDSSWGGAVIYFESHDPRYSYVEIDGRGMVQATAEKKVISSHALTGLYIFSSIAVFKKAAEEELLHVRSEPFISRVFNRLIIEKKEVYAFPLDHHYSFGTPEEMKASLEALKKEGRS